MELLHLAYLIRWLDERWLRPLRRWVPDLEQVLAAPAQVLQGRKIEIGPRRHYVKWFLVLVLLPLPGLVAVEEFHSKLFAASLIFAWLLLVAGMFHTLRGGRCIFRYEGIDFCCRGLTVFCPWELFHAEGQPIYYPETGQLALPVVPGAIARIEVRRKESLVPQALDGQAAHLRLVGTGEIHLKLVYGVKPEELGNFLMELGRKLGARAKPAKPGMVPSAAESEAGGWIRVSLTRLRFPPLCCDCVQPTYRLQEFIGYPSFLGGAVSLAAAEQSVQVMAPVCEPCWRANRRRYWWTLLKTTFLAVIGTTFLGFLLGLTLDLVGVTPDRGAMTVLVPMSALMASLALSWIFTAKRARAVSEPLRLSDYQSGDGTVRFRFRNGQYADVFLVALKATRR